MAFVRNRHNFFVETLAIFTCKTFVFLRENPCSLEKYLRSPRNFAFTCKPFTLACKTFAFPEILSLHAKLLRSPKKLCSLVKLLHFPEKLCPFQNVCVPLKNFVCFQKFCVPPRNFMVTHKTFAFPWGILHSPAKLLFSWETLHSQICWLAKLLHFTEKLFVHLQKFCVPWRNFAFTCKTFVFP